MLMTVLKGDLAVQQSMALIRLFKQMKDYIAAENAPDVRTLSNKVERNESFLQKVMAKKSLLIVDDYLDVKTLDLLRCVAKGVSVKIFSEQHGRTRLTESMLADFRAARPDVELGDVRTTGNLFHDRYIYLDFGTDTEKLFHCGASSKDAGNKITTIMQLEDIVVYRPLFERLLREGEQEFFQGTNH
jgi:hypothetical protein